MVVVLSADLVSDRTATPVSCSMRRAAGHRFRRTLTHQAGAAAGRIVDGRTADASVSTSSLAAAFCMMILTVRCYGREACCAVGKRTSLAIARPKRRKHKRVFVAFMRCVDSRPLLPIPEQYILHWKVSERAYVVSIVNQTDPGSAVSRFERIPGPESTVTAVVCESR